MQKRLMLGDIPADVVFKDIKNVHLSVYPPNGRVRISAPMRMKLDSVRVFAISKLPWIKQQRKKLQEQEREAPREYVDRESHYVWGTRYLLRVVETDERANVELKHRRMVLHVRPGATEATRCEVVARWYRQLVREEAAQLIAKWERVLRVRVNGVHLRQMKTKWGSCNVATDTIRLNTELAKKPKECLEYIVVHEMVHMLEPSHNARFVALMDQYMPKWQFYRQKLNRLPVAHTDWNY